MRDFFIGGPASSPQRRFGRTENVSIGASSGSRVDLVRSLPSSAQSVRAELIYIKADRLFGFVIRYTYFERAASPMQRRTYWSGVAYTGAEWKRAG